MTESDVEMTEAVTDEVKDDTSAEKWKVSQAAGSSKSLDVATKAYELPWLVKTRGR